MKKLIASFSGLMLIAFIFASCSDNNVTEPAQGAPAPSGKSLSVQTALSVTIGGPTNVMMPAKGHSTTATWTAAATGGTPPYTYLWNQPGDNDNQSYSVTYYYSAGQSDHTVNLACTVTDALGAVATATYPYVEDYSPYNPDI
ncbi:MAG TPA: hypothetical protein VHP30_11680 [Ignavibacteriales bacterium]|nr:hypothetical protein [Ignavibacteriales bacterium]